MTEMKKTQVDSVAGDADDAVADVATGGDAEIKGDAKSARGAAKVEDKTGMPGLRSDEKISGYISKYIGKGHAEFKSGDTVRVHYKIVEGNKERIQVFEGVVIAIRHSDLDKTFTVRKVSWNIGVERTFFYNSRKIDKIEVVRRGKVHRAKIYYLRKRVGKAARIKELRKPKPAP